MTKEGFNALCDLTEVTCIDLIKWDDEKPQFIFLASSFLEKSITAYFSKENEIIEIPFDTDELWKRKHSAKEFIDYLREKINETKN